MPYSTISHCQVLTKHIRTARPIADDEFLRVREVCQFARWGCFFLRRRIQGPHYLLPHPSPKGRSYYKRAVMADAADRCNDSVG